MEYESRTEYGSPEGSERESSSAGAVESAKGKATEQAQQVTGQVTDKAREVQGTVQGRMREQLDTRSTQAGEQVGTVSDAMRNMGEQLRGQGNDMPAQLVHQVANQTEQLGRYLRESDADKILRDVEDFGRRQPWVVAAAGLALGVAAARFLKASSKRRYEQSMYGGGTYARDPYRLGTPPASEVDYTAAPAGAYGVGTTGEYGTTGTPVTPLGEETAAGAYPTEPFSGGTRPGATTGEQESGVYPPRGSE